jgi:hypothetical protein
VAVFLVYILKLGLDEGRETRWGIAGGRCGEYLRYSYCSEEEPCLIRMVDVNTGVGYSLKRSVDENLYICKGDYIVLYKYRSKVIQKDWWTTVLWPFTPKAPSWDAA